MTRDAKARRAAFGDFQTPPDLALTVTRLVRQLVPTPATIIEPTCGSGNFLVAVASEFPAARRLFGVDIHAGRLAACRAGIREAQLEDRVRILTADFFQFDWMRVLSRTPGPALAIGNPPWVTTSALGRLGGQNSPRRRPQPGQSGIDAITGKGNFDISESMLLTQVRWFDRRPGAVAALVKESAARKVLHTLWMRRIPLASARIFRFDAREAFGVSVRACLLVIIRDGTSGPATCAVHRDLSLSSRQEILGMRDGLLLRDVGAYDRWKHLRGADGNYVWRSGVKHDCARVMELRPRGNELRNGLGERVGIEARLLFPLYKSADLNGGGSRGPRRRVIVTQRRLNAETRTLRKTAPKAWRYLEAHRDAFTRRSSAVYHGRPPFAMFGIGPYSFAPWKVAIAGLYQPPRPRVLAPVAGQPAMVDDTGYFLPCRAEEEAAFLAGILRSRPAARFWGSMIFLGDKRPVGAALLKRLHPGRLARELGRGEEYDAHVAARRADNGWGDPRRRLFGA